MKPVLTALAVLLALPGVAYASTPEKEMSDVERDRISSKVWRVHLKGRSTHVFKTQVVGRREGVDLAARVNGRDVQAHELMSETSLEASWRQHGILVSLVCRAKRSRCTVRLASFRRKPVRVRVEATTWPSPEPAPTSEPVEPPVPEQICEFYGQVDCTDPPEGYPEDQPLAPAR